MFAQEIAIDSEIGIIMTPFAMFGTLSFVSFSNPKINKCAIDKVIKIHPRVLRKSLILSLQ